MLATAVGIPNSQRKPSNGRAASRYLLTVFGALWVARSNHSNEGMSVVRSPTLAMVTAVVWAVGDCSFTVGKPSAERPVRLSVRNGLSAEGAFSEWSQTATVTEIPAR
jgi:hypothetical protein